MKTNIGTQLRTGDPLRHKSKMSSEQVAATKAAMFAAMARPVRPTSWLQRFAVRSVVTAAAAMAILAAVLLNVRHRDSGRFARTVTQVQPEQPVRRQIQFQTPGGTKIVWVLSSDVNF